MDAHRQVVYSEPAQGRRRQMVQDFERRLDAEIAERKYVPGVDVVEATASDLEELSRSMQVLFRDRYDQRLRTRALVVNTYVFIGTATVVVGLFYDRVLELLREPTRAWLIGVGLAMTLAGLVLRFSLESRSRTLRRERELIQALDERERQRPSGDA